MDKSNFGFIITRHVMCERTNKYWNKCVWCIRRFYPFKKIIIIDDNSDQTFIKAYKEYQNLEVINSEFPGRGELLPYYYFYKHHFFENAVIIHDSVFFHKRINFEGVRPRVLPLWHFNSDKENVGNTLYLINYLKNNADVYSGALGTDINVLGFKKTKWFGCFGVQSYINYDFLSYLQSKYELFNLLHVVKNRSDRCCIERILGILFFSNQKYLYKQKSLLGNIMTYSKWGYTFEEYNSFLAQYRASPLPVVKVWTGR